MTTFSISKVDYFAGVIDEELSSIKTEEQLYELIGELILGYQIVGSEDDAHSEVPKS